MKILMNLFLTMGLFVPGLAQNSAPEYAILIVGDEGAAEMLRQEKVLISEMAKTIRQQTPNERLPILSYHFNKERERTYCENKLNVLAEDLLFVGIVRLENKVPLKVVYRVDRITNPGRAAQVVLGRAEELLQEAGGTVQVEPAKQPDSKQPDSNGAANGAGGFRVQLGSFAQKNYADDKVAQVRKSGLSTSILTTTGPDGDALYKVLSPILPSREQADELLSKFHQAGFEEAILVRAKGE